MLEVVAEIPLDGIQVASDFSLITYQIAPGFTLDECRDAIKGRHIGQPWGQ
jgi:hypothetical protein